MAQTREEESLKAQLEQARGRVELANKWRLAFMLIALLILLFIFWGDKLWGETLWYEAAKGKAYFAALLDLTAMLAATFAKLFLTVRYNRLVKKQH